MEKIDDCPICFEPYDQEDHRSMVLHPCGHVFGRPCIFNHFRTSKNNIAPTKVRNANTAPCPLCKTPFTKKQVGPLFIPTRFVENENNVQSYQKEIANLEEFVSEMKKEKDGYETQILTHRNIIEEKIAKLNQYQSHTHNLATALYRAQTVQNQLMEQKAALMVLVAKQKDEIENLKISGRTLGNTLLQFSNIQQNF